MTAQPDHVLSITIPPASAPGTARSATAPAGVPALLSPVSCPGTPPGTTVPSVLAAGGVGTGGQLVRITRLAHAAPGKPDGEVDTARWSLCGSEPAVAAKLARPTSSDFRTMASPTDPAHGRRYPDSPGWRTCPRRR
jgi:hypothetical protein